MFLDEGLPQMVRVNDDDVRPSGYCAVLVVLLRATVALGSIKNVSERFEKDETDGEWKHSSGRKCYIQLCTVTSGRMLPLPPGISYSRTY